METAVAVALIAAFAGLLTSAWSTHRQAQNSRLITTLQHRLQEDSQREARQLEAKEQLDRFREPLLTAADDLRHRIVNIREKHFLSYLRSGDQHRRQVALLGTLYRFGRYWAEVDGLYGTVDLIRFETEPETKHVTALLANISTVMASDSLGGGRLMVWRDEQRAVAELMRTPGGGVVGFATFVADYSAAYAGWFADLERDLQASTAEGSPRLRQLQALLADLVQQLKAGRPALQ